MRAKLRLLEVGPRPEEILAQRRRVERAQLWRDSAKQDLTRARQAFRAEVDELDRLIAQQRAECSYAEATHGRAQRLVYLGAVSAEDYQGRRKNHEVIRAEVEKAEARRRARLARGAREAVSGERVAERQSRMATLFFCGHSIEKRARPRC